MPGEQQTKKESLSWQGQLTLIMRRGWGLLLYKRDRKTTFNSPFDTLLFKVKMKWKWKLLSHVQLCVTPWTVARQAPLSMEFFRQEYWGGLPFPSPADLPKPGTEPRSPALQADSSPTEPPEKPFSYKCILSINYCKGIELLSVSEPREDVAMLCKQKGNSGWKTRD